MAATDQAAADAAAEMTARFRAAVEAGDPDGGAATLASDVVLHSPITDRVAFRGPDEVGELLRLVFATISDIRYFAEVGDARTRTLFYRGRIGAQPLEEATRLELDDRQRIREITLFFRPLPG